MQIKIKAYAKGETGLDLLSLLFFAKVNDVVHSLYELIGWILVSEACNN